MRHGVEVDVGAAAEGGEELAEGVPPAGEEGGAAGIGGAPGGDGEVLLAEVHDLAASGGGLGGLPADQAEGGEEVVAVAAGAEDLDGVEGAVDRGGGEEALEGVQRRGGWRGGEVAVKRCLLGKIEA